MVENVIGKHKPRSMNMKLDNVILKILSYWVYQNTESSGLKRHLKFHKILKVF